jgi:hypothetical protein
VDILYIPIKNKTKQNKPDMKPEFLSPGLNSWISTCQIRPFAPIYQIKRNGEGLRKEIYYTIQDMLWEETE